MAQKKKILFLFTRPPYPANDGTKIKILSNMLDGVRDTYDCTIAIISDVPPDADAVAYLEKHYGRVKYFYRSRFQRALYAAWWWLCGYPLQAGFFYSSSTARALRKDFEEADVIYAHTLRFGKYLEGLPPALQKKALLDFNDAISLNYHTARRYAGGLWKYIYAAEESHVRRYEKKLLSHPFHFLIVSTADRDYLAAPVIKVIHHGVPDALLEYSNRHNGDRNIVFMGNMFYPPNRESVEWFARFAETHSFEGTKGSLFDVVGRTPLGLKEKFPGVSFEGFVDDPRVFVIQHKIFVAPLRFGAGVQTKVLEAMALGMPVITSDVGARGIDGAQDGENILIVAMDDEAAWVSTITKLLQDQTLRMKIGDGARKLIKERYTASRARAQFLELVDTIASDAHRR